MLGYCWEWILGKETDRTECRKDTWYWEKAGLVVEAVNLVYSGIERDSIIYSATSKTRQIPEIEACRSRHLHCSAAFSMSRNDQFPMSTIRSCTEIPAWANHFHRQESSCIDSPSIGVTLSLEAFVAAYLNLSQFYQRFGRLITLRNNGVINPIAKEMYAGMRLKKNPP